jgi:hypothetical protein
LIGEIAKLQTIGLKINKLQITKNQIENKLKIESQIKLLMTCHRQSVLYAATVTHWL